MIIKEIKKLIYSLEKDDRNAIEKTVNILKAFIFNDIIIDADTVYYDKNMFDKIIICLESIINYNEYECY